MPKYTFLTEQEFDTIKELLYRGETIEEIRKQTGRSYPTVKTVEGNISYESYKDSSSNYWRSKKNKIPVGLGANPLYDQLVISIRSQVLEEIEQTLLPTLKVAIRDLIRDLNRTKRGGVYERSNSESNQVGGDDSRGGAE